MRAKFLGLILDPICGSDLWIRHFGIKREVHRLVVQLIFSYLSILRAAQLVILINNEGRRRSDCNRHSATFCDRSTIARRLGKHRQRLLLGR